MREVNCVCQQQGIWTFQCSPVEDVADSATGHLLQVTGPMSSSPMGMSSEHSMRSCISCASLVTSVANASVLVCHGEVKSH